MQYNANIERIAQYDNSLHTDYKKSVEMVVNVHIVISFVEIAQVKGAEFSHFDEGTLH